MCSRTGASTGGKPGKTSDLLHPFLLAAYPILHIYASNLGQAALADILRPLAFSLLLAAVSLAAAGRLLRDRAKAGLFASFFVITFLSYGHALRALSRITGNPMETIQSVSLFFWLALVLAVLVTLMRTRRDLSQLGRLAFVLGGVLAALLMAKMFWYAVTSITRGENAADWQAVIAVERKRAREMWAKTASSPDIYYIVLDKYARHDVLKTHFDYDNSPFIDYLTNAGFYVAKRARCNYLGTDWSLSSSLNYDYLDTLLRAARQKPTYATRGRVWNSRICRVLKDKGYKYIQLDSGWHVTQASPYADIVMPRSVFDLTELERVFIDRSVLRVPFEHQLDAYLRRRTLRQFDDLVRISRIKEKTFTFAHIVCPHGPYVFDRQGNMPATRTGHGTEESKLYVNQLHYTNKLVRQTVDSIMANSHVPPIIILQSDHGCVPPDKVPSDGNRAPTLSDEQLIKYARLRSPILSAYYFPGAGTKALYETITPVNSFRVMLNEYFGGDYALLPDVTYRPRRGEQLHPATPEQLEKLDDPLD